MFEDVIVDVAAAIICFASTCHPALVGKDTPKGEFQLTHYSTKDPGYGGDILVFKETETELFAIHRVLDLPGQQRLARLRSPYAEHRITITAGCVNIDPVVYEELVNCCYKSKVIIK
jgi:hypothetical protein